MLGGDRSKCYVAARALLDTLLRHKKVESGATHLSVLAKTDAAKCGKKKKEGEAGSGFRGG